MIILGLDGGLGGFSAGLARDDQPLAAVEIPGTVALEQGLGAVSDVLQKAGIAGEQVDKVAVGIGPGGFTGVRIAISYAKSLAQGWRRPLVGVSSFDVLEAGVQAGSALPLLTVIHGRTGVVSVRLRSDDRVVRASGYLRDVLDEIEASLGVKDVQLLGNAEGVVAALGERGFGVQILSRVTEPAALAVALLARARQPAHSFHEVRADYGELPAAKTPRFGGAHRERLK